MSPGQQTGESCQSPGGRALAPAGKEHKAAGLRGPAVFALGRSAVPPRLLRPPAVPSHRGTENMLMLVADGFYFRSIRRSDTYTAMVSPCEGQGLHLASQSTLAAATGLALHARKGRGGGKKEKLKFLSDLIYLNKYKYNFYIKLFTDKEPSQTQTGDL